MRWVVGGGESGALGSRVGCGVLISVQLAARRACQHHCERRDHARHGGVVPTPAMLPVAFRSTRVYVGGRMSDAGCRMMSDVGTPHPPGLPGRTRGGARARGLHPQIPPGLQQWHPLRRALGRGAASPQRSGRSGPGGLERQTSERPDGCAGQEKLGLCVGGGWSATLIVRSAKATVLEPTHAAPTPGTSALLDVVADGFSAEAIYTDHPVSLGPGDGHWWPPLTHPNGRTGLSAWAPHYRPVCRRTIVARVQGSARARVFLPVS